MYEKLLKEYNELQAQINNLEKKQIEVANNIKSELAKLGKVKGLAEYVKFMRYPISQIFDSFGRDSGEYDEFNGVRIKAVFDYCYTDFVGLTDEEFSELEELLNESEK